MKKRQKPSPAIIQGISGGSYPFITSMHNGLYETDLRGVYPYLDLDELLSFCASSWKRRETLQNTRNPIKKEKYDRFVENASLYEILSEAYSSPSGMKWLNKNNIFKKDNLSNLNPRIVTKYRKLNPFKRKDLKARIRDFEKDKKSTKQTDHIKKVLKSNVFEYVFEINYFRLKRLRGGDNYGLVCLSFLPKYPPKHEEFLHVVIPSYAKEISKILSYYPTKIKHEDKPNQVKPKQYSLFRIKF